MKKEVKIGIIALAICVVAFFIIIATKKQNVRSSEDDKITLEDSINNTSNEIIVEEPPASSDVTNTEKQEVMEDSTYEEWLAAAMTVAISMRYTDFEIEDIYYKSETAPANRMDCEGIYIKLKTDGNTVFLFSKPLKEENKEAGSVNIYSQEIGFASFEEFAKNEVSVKKYKKYTVEEIEKMIQFSTLVSIYEN